MLSDAAIAFASKTGPNDDEALALLRKVMPKLPIYSHQDIERALKRAAKRRADE